MGPGERNYHKPNDDVAFLNVENMVKLSHFATEYLIEVDSQSDIDFQKFAFEEDLLNRGGSLK